MRRFCFLLIMTIVSAKSFTQVLSSENGLSVQNNTVRLGGDLTQPTLINGNFNALRFTNIDTFFLGGRVLQFLNSTRKTSISSFDTLSLQSFNNILISAANTTTIDGGVKLTGYKNSATLDSVLTVDNCGNLKLVSQKSLQTIAQNAFTNNGNAFGASAYLGTTDKNFLFFKTNNIVRGSIDTVGTFNYNYPVNINNTKLKTTGDIEINGNQANGTVNYQKASSGINFVWGTEPLPRASISFNGTTSSINFTAHGALRFYSAQPGIPLSSTIPDLIIGNGTFKFGGRYARIKNDEPSAAYQFTDYVDPYGIPKGILLPRVTNTYLRDYIKSPAEGLMIYNMEKHDLEIYKPDGWHRFVTANVNAPVTATTTSTTTPTTLETMAAGSANNTITGSSASVIQASPTSYVEAVGDGSQKVYSIVHNLNSQFVMIQFIDCGPEANCNLLAGIPKGVRVELDGKNKALITFDEAPSFSRYKVMFLKVQ